MISDALLAFLVISSSIIMIESLLNINIDYTNQYLHSVVSDTATLIDYSGINNTQTIINSAPRGMCLKAVITNINGTIINELVTNGCPTTFNNDKAVIFRTTIQHNNYYLIKVSGWWLRE